MAAKVMRVNWLYYQFSTTFSWHELYSFLISTEMTDHNDTNSQQQTNNTNDADEDLNYLFITQIVFYCAISAVGTFANVIILIGLLRGRLRSSECFIMNLAIADLLVCAVGIPLDIYQHYSKWWPYGKVLCHVIYPLQTSLILISILTLMGMSIERHRAICSPLKRRWDFSLLLKKFINSININIHTSLKICNPGIFNVKI